MNDKAIGNGNDALSADFRDFITALSGRQVEFVLVGGYAVGAYGVIRATADIDFLYRRTPANVARLCDALRDFGAPRNVVDAESLLTPDTVVMFGSPPHRIDLLGDISGVDFEAVWSGSRRIVLDGLPLQLIGLAELRRNKAATGRAKDKADLRQLPTSEEGPGAGALRRPKKRQSR